MVDLKELLDRVKAATGPDRELDCRLSHHFDRKGIWYGTGDDSGWAPASTVDGWDEATWLSMKTEYVSRLIPAYTASIDAALALTERVLPGSLISITQMISKWQASILEMDPEHEDAVVADWVEDALSAPLAILAATLAALIAKDNQP